jgi:hypothetical protein
MQIIEDELRRVQIKLLEAALNRKILKRKASRNPTGTGLEQWR